LSSSILYLYELKSDSFRSRPHNPGPQNRRLITANQGIQLQQHFHIGWRLWIKVYKDKVTSIAKTPGGADARFLIRPDNLYLQSLIIPFVLSLFHQYESSPFEKNA